MIVAPSILSVIRKAAALARVLPTVPTFAFLFFALRATRSTLVPLAFFLSALEITEGNGKIFVDTEQAV